MISAVDPTVRQAVATALARQPTTGMARVTGNLPGLRGNGPRRTHRL